MGAVGVVVAAFSDSCGLLLFFRFGALQGIAVFPKLGGYCDLLPPSSHLKMWGSRGRTYRASCTWEPWIYAGGTVSAVDRVLEGTVCQHTGADFLAWVPAQSAFPPQLAVPPSSGFSPAPLLHDPQHPSLTWYLQTSTSAAFASD